MLILRTTRVLQIQCLKMTYIEKSLMFIYSESKIDLYYYPMINYYLNYFKLR